MGGQPDVNEMELLGVVLVLRLMTKENCRPN
jgi:hypothetical protein